MAVGDAFQFDYYTDQLLQYYPLEECEKAAELRGRNLVRHATTKP